MSYDVEVARGAALLDLHQPGWRSAVRPDDLEMNECESCIIGQVFGCIGTSAYKQALTTLGAAVADDPARFGFDTGPGDYGAAAYDELGDDWRYFLSLEVA